MNTTKNCVLAAVGHTPWSLSVLLTFASHAHIERGGGAGHFLTARPLTAPVVVQKEGWRARRKGLAMCLLRSSCKSISCGGGTRT